MMACYRYIELNPVRAGMVEHPEAYRWSSFATNGRGVPDPLVTPHEVYQQLATDAEQRREAYRSMVSEAVPDDEIAAIRLYAQRQRALGSNKFQLQIERQLEWRAGIGRPGRPRKELVL